MATFCADCGKNITNHTGPSHECKQQRAANRATAKTRVYDRVDFVPFKNGQMVDLGGFDNNLTKAQAETAAKIVLGMYGHDRVSVEANGVIIATVTR